ncbi:MAG: glycoside hydrolase family 3 C-terminal domain-containing protein [Clostridia bacterium]|nr:glycoside hydrolase family 3 C-terminal domain-containing protein [Clostridia bacterium]
MRRKAFWQGMTLLFVFLLCFVVVVMVILDRYSFTVGSYLGSVSTVLTSDDPEGLYEAFTPDENYVETDADGNITSGKSKAVIQGAIDQGHQEGAEGTVLLKNDGALPLKSADGDQKKVTLLGLRSHMPLLGAGMGVKVAGPVITLEDALSRNSTDWTNPAKWTSGSVGSDMDVFEFTGANYLLNQTAIDFYDKWNGTAGYDYGDAVFDSGINIKEPSKEELVSALGESFKEYNDAAIVVIARNGGETTDYLPGNVTEGQGNSEPLELTTNEKDMIQVAEDNFSTVIVLVNCGCAMEIDELKNDPGVDAILHISYPGCYGMLGVADVLDGNVSPSGGLPDIYAAKDMSAPAMQNMGDYSFTNTDSISRAQSYNYIIEAENIYTGYRYYETRYEDAVLNASSTKASGNYGVYNASNAGVWDYSDEVSYGFGYGLSYTTFTQEMEGEPEVVHDGHTFTMTFKVKVTNTGDYAGKSSVQIYGQAPYVSGGLEKSSVQLLAYGKTRTLDPGDSQTLEITADLQNLASYDSSVDNGDGTCGTYVLDEGDYYFAIGNGAHDALNNIILTKDPEARIESEDIDKTGADVSKLAYEYTYDVASGETDTETFSVTKNGQQVSNQLEYADFNYYYEQDHNGEDFVTYLTRADWSTFPAEYDNVAAPASMLDDLDGKYYTVQTDEDTSGFTWGSTETSHKLYELTNASWDDPMWDDLLDQLTINESMYLSAFGGPVLPEAQSIGIYEFLMTENDGNGIVLSIGGSMDPDAPWAIPSSDKNSAWCGQCFGASPLLAGAFNPELALRRGELVGNESLFMGVPIIWGPGLNTHRQAYNGRNCEYYSEDPVLCGITAEYYAYGAGEFGLLAATKHFAFNDQETNRQGVAPFMTEQRAREVELRAYQIAVECSDKEAIAALAVHPNASYEGLFGCMTSFSKIGAVECTCSHGLLTGILRDEWGFHGYVVSDILDDTDLYSCVVYAGLTGYDIRGAEQLESSTSLSNYELFRKAVQKDGVELDENAYKGDATMMQALKSSNKNLLWGLAHTNLMNRYNATTHTESRSTSINSMLTAVVAVLGVLTAVCAVLYVIAVIRYRKKFKGVK